MSPAPDVCVVISVRNGERYLAEAIESVLTQQDADLELRVYDNGSTDRSVEIARSYERDGRVTVASNPEGTSYFGSLNRALRETAAPFLAPFACDDLMLAGNLAEKVAALAETGAAFAHSQSVVIDGEGVASRIWCDYTAAPRVSEPGEFFPHMAPVNTTILMAAVCRTDALREIGGFDERLVYCGDWLALLLLALRGRVVTLHRPLVGYRRHAESGSAAWHQGATWVGELVEALALAVGDLGFPPPWRGEAAPLFAGCLEHCVKELREAGVLRTDSSGTSAYACAARMAELLPDDERLRDLFADAVAAAGLTVPPVPFDLVAPPPESAADAARLLERCASLTNAGLAGRVLIGCPDTDVAAIAALLGPEADRRPEVDVVLGPVTGAEELLLPGRVAACPAHSSAFLALAEQRGLPVLAHDLPGVMAAPWDRNLESVLAAATRAAEAQPRPLPQPSPELLAFADQFPWERGTILSFVQGVAASLPPGTSVLDVGAGDSPYRELFAHLDYRTTDWTNSVHPGARAVDYVGSADDLPIPDASFEAVLNTQVLEHVAEPLAVLRELHRVLAPGGRLFLTVPLVWELHEEPYDFYRYTAHGLTHLLGHAGFEDVSVAPRNDCFTTVAQLLRNLGVAMGRRPDGLDPQRELASHTLSHLADLVASYAPLDTQWILPLGYAVTARRPVAPVDARRDAAVTHAEAAS